VAGDVWNTGADWATHLDQAPMRLARFSVEFHDSFYRGIERFGQLSDSQKAEFVTTVVGSGVLLGRGVTALGGATSARTAAGTANAAATTADEIMPTPLVGNAKLRNVVDNLYKGTTNPNRVGNGTTMDAIRHELATGVPTGRRFHTIKGQETLRGLDLVAQSLADELSLVLRGGE
jgi:hypothetical protein